MTQTGKVIMVVGGLVLVVGAIVWELGQLGFRGLPGDIRYESERVKIYVPIVTCLIISLALSVLLWLARSLMHR